MTALSESLRTTLRQLTGASEVGPPERLQELWSGYGQILRVPLAGGQCGDSVIVKHVHPPTASDHPRGWNTDRSHQRKLRSYEVEIAWYQQWNHRCLAACRTPALIGARAEAGQMLLVLEDLDPAGFPQRPAALSDAGLKACLAWLAEFHATFLHEQPTGLWETGTYWHLATRPDELAALPDGPLRTAAPAIDQRLSRARFQTLVHGDAKLANFCFGQEQEQVAALDFQYVGGGCGMKDVAYFLGSALDEVTCQAREAELLAHYFARLTHAAAPRLGTSSTTLLEAEWRALYPYAWADFHRFLQGWSPGHWKLTPYSEHMVQLALDDLSSSSTISVTR